MALALDKAHSISRSGASLPALVGLALVLGLPFGRPGRPLLTLEPSFYPWNLNSPWVWMVVGALALSLVVSLLPFRRPLRADVITFVGAVGFLAGVYWLLSTGTPFGLGAVAAIVALIVVMGHGLSESGRVQSDAFVASSILFVSLLVLLFIIYPLTTVLRSAVVVNGQWTLAKVVSTLRSPLFLFLENPFTPRSELALMGYTALGGTVVGVLYALLRRLNIGWILLWSGIGAGLGFIVGVMLFGQGAMATSLLLAAIVAPLSTLFGLAFALLGQRSRFGFVRRSLNFVSLLPIITPPFVLAFAMIFLFGRRGLITYSLFGLSTNTIFGLTGVAMAQLLAFTPIAYLILRGSVVALDPALEEAAQTLGSSRWQTFRDITWPLLRPGLAAALLLVVIESFADFGNPIILGGDRSYLATEVFLALTGRYDPNEAAVYGSVLLAIVLLAFSAQALWLGRSSFVTVTGKPSSGSFSLLPGWLETLLLTVFFLWLVLVMGLYASVVFGSFVRLWGINNTLTLDHYAAFMRAGWPVLLYSFRIALIAAVPTALLGFLIAYLVARQRFWGRRFVEFGSLLSFATPGTVMGVAYILAFNTGPWLLTSTGVIIILALIFREMPVAIRAGVSGLAQIDKSLEEASTTLRASSGVTLRRVLLPLLIYPLLAGLIFAFVRGMTAVSQVIFLVSPGNQLATVLLLGWVEQGQLGRAAAMGTMLIVTMLATIMLLLPLTRGRNVEVNP